MPNSEIGKRKQHYQRLLDEHLKNTGNSENYQQILNELSELIKFCDIIDSKDSDMTPEQHRNITQKYSDFLRNCSSYLQKSEYKSSSGRDRIVNHLFNTLYRDFEVLRSMDNEKPGKYTEAVRYARAVKINVSGKKFNKRGGALNVRVPMRLSDGTKGFYTSRSMYNYDEQWKRAVNAYGKFFSDQGKILLNNLITDMKARNKFAFASARYQFDPKGSIVLAMEALGYSQKQIDAVRNTTGFVDDLPELKRFMEKTFTLSNSTSLLNIAGISKHSRLDNRNAAMCTIAEMIGCGNSLAKAKEVAVVTDGKKTYGTFMETAEGVDINVMQMGTPISKIEKESFRTVEFYRQLADLQAIDYICGNLDRHSGNIVYTFDESDPPKIIGLKGIDNDLSFGNKSFASPDTVLLHLAHPEEMGIISETTANNILAIDNPAALKASLRQYSFSKEELEAAWSRLQTMRNAILENKIIKVKDNEWEETINKIYNNEIKLSPDSRFKIIEEELFKRKERYWNNPHNATKAPIEYADASKGGFEVDIKNRNDEIQRLIEAMKAADRHFGSKEFVAMRDSLYKLGDTTKQFAAQIGKGESLSEEQVNKLNHLYEIVGENTADYITKKKLEPSTSHGKLKLALATELQDVLMDTEDLNISQSGSEIEQDEFNL